MRRGHIAGPLILIAIGMLFLLNNLGWNLPLGYLISRFWPLILIAIGFVQIAGALVGRGSLSGGIVVLTIGALFAVQQIWYLRLRDTWPVLLIAIGAIGLLRSVLAPALFGHRLMRGGLRR